MDERIECMDCKHYKSCTHNKIEGVGEDTAKLMIVTDMPSKFDDEHGTVMGGEVGEYIKSVLNCIEGMDFKDVYFTSMLKCRGEKTSKKELDACTKYLNAEILRIKPVCILTMGEIAMNGVCQTKKITKWRGKAQTVSIMDKDEAPFIVPVLPTYGAGYVMRVESKLEEWAFDMLKAYRIAHDIMDDDAITKIVYCDTLDKVKLAAEYCQQTGVACFDFEGPKLDKLLVTFEEGYHATMLSLSFQIGSSYVIPLEHPNSPFDKGDVTWIMEHLRATVFENPRVRKIAHNLNFDYHILRIYDDIKLRGRIDDTMLMHHLYDETQRHGLKGLVSEFFPEFTGYDSEIAGMDWLAIPIKTLAKYNGTDTDVTLRLVTHMESELLKDERVYRIYRNLTMAAFRPLWEAERRGMDIDKEYLRSAIDELDLMIAKHEKKLRDHPRILRYEAAVSHEKTDDKIQELKAKIKKWLTTHKEGLKTEIKYRQQISDLKTGAISVYTGINFNSPPQMSNLLYDHDEGFLFGSLDGGTGKDILAELDDDTGFIDGLLLYRSLKKMQGTYLSGLMKRMDAEGRVHTSLKLHGTVSGRLSSANPNLQNLPNISKLKDADAIKAVGMVKKAFIPPVGHHIVQIDYSQAELRVIADFANETNMLKAYMNDEDLHARGAATLLGIPLEEFYKLDKGYAKERRTRAKARNFGLIYAMSAKGYVDYAKGWGLDYTLDEAKRERDNFFKLYPKLIDYHENYIAKGLKFGWVRTLFGRRRRVPNIDSGDSFLRGMDERVAINSPIQGTAGEFTIFAIALLYQRLDPRIIFVNTVHDSIIFYIPDDILDEAITSISKTCEELPTEQYFKAKLRKLGMKVDAEASPISWKDLKEVEINR